MEKYSRPMLLLRSCSVDKRKTMTSSKVAKNYNQCQQLLPCSIKSWKTSGNCDKLAVSRIWNRLNRSGGFPAPSLAERAKRSVNVHCRSAKPSTSFWDSSRRPPIEIVSEQLLFVLSTVAFAGTTTAPSWNGFCRFLCSNLRLETDIVSVSKFINVHLCRSS